MPGASNFPSGFINGLTVRGVPITLLHPGKVWWVNNSGVLPEGGIDGSDGNPGTYQKPFSTVDYAIGRCTAARGDIIALMPGHTETLTAAGDITLDVQGVAIVGLGVGSLQPQFHFTTDAGADIDITAADCTFYNCRFTAGVQDITPGALDISGDNLTLQNCLIDEDGSNENYVIVANIATTTDGLWVEGCEYRGTDADNDHLLEFAGSHDHVVIKDNHFAQLTARTATVALIESATDQDNIRIIGNTFVMADAAVEPGCVVLTGTGNTGIAKDNVIVSPDTAAVGSNLVSAFDVTGCGSFDNKAVVTADNAGQEFGTAEDFT